MEPVISRNKRWDRPGATYFVTLVTQDRRRLFADATNIQLLRDALDVAQNKHPFRMRAYAIMPDHVHLQISLAPDIHISITMQSLQQSFTQRFKVEYGISPKTHIRLWQRGFYDHVIRDADDFENHSAYIHYNPVKHGLVTSARDYAHTSLGAYLARGWYAPDWGVSVPEEIEDWELG